MAGASQAALALYQSLPPVQQAPQQWLDAAKRLIDAGECRRAKLLLETVLQADQGNGQASALLVSACLALGPNGWPEALSVARRAAAAVHSAPSGSEQAAAVQLALAAALGHVARTPVMAQPERSKHRAEARSVLESVLDRSPSNTAALYMLGLISAEGGHYDAAVANARAALQPSSRQESAGTAAVLALLALLISARQQPQAALTVADTGLSIAQKVPGASHICTLLSRIKAQLLLAAGDVNGALAVLGAAKRKLAVERADVAPGEGGRHDEAEVWRDLALAYASQQQERDARFCAEQAGQLELWSAANLHMQGVVEEAAGNAQAAMDAYQAALALDSSHAPTLLSLGTLLRRQGSPADLCVASRMLSDALRYEPHNHEGWYDLGLVSQAQGHRDEAERHLFGAVKLAAAAPVLSYGALPLCL